MSHDDLAATEHRIKQATGLLDEDAYCLTIIVGATQEQVFGAFRVDGTAPAESLEDIREEPDYVPVVALMEMGGAVLAVEPNGYFGHLEEVLGPVSAGRRAASFYSGNDGEAILDLAENGVVRFSEEYPDDATELDDEWQPFFAGLGWDLDSWEAVALTVLERFTGVRIECPAPAEPMLVRRVPDE